MLSYAAASKYCSCWSSSKLDISLLFSPPITPSASTTIFDSTSGCFASSQKKVVSAEATVSRPANKKLTIISFKYVSSFTQLMNRDSKSLWEQSSVFLLCLITSLAKTLIVLTASWSFFSEPTLRSLFIFQTRGDTDMALSVDNFDAMSKESLKLHSSLIKIRIQGLRLYMGVCKCAWKRNIRWNHILTCDRIFINYDIIKF